MSAARLRTRPLKVHCQTCPNRGKATLCTIGPELLIELDQAKTAQYYPRGSTLFLQGNQPLGLYALVSGKVKITRTGLAGRRQIVRLAAAGELIGYRALLADQAYSASAEAFEDCRVCFVDKPFFRKILSSSEDLSNAFFKKLSLELGIAEGKMQSFAQTSVRQRLAELICDLHRRFSIQDGLLDVTLTREEMAELTGTTTESAIRTMRDFQKRGWIEQSPRQCMRICDLDALKSAACWQDIPA